MVKVRGSEERGHVEYGWLDTRHTFSFGHYHDPAHMGFGDLRVINEDHVAPGRGFAPHGHRDMEILTVVLEGALEHRDSMGNGSVIRPGEVQRMTAGTGVQHSEMNASAAEPVHLLQIWVLPERAGLTPGYEQKAFPEDARTGRLQLLASRDGREGSVTVHQDMALYATRLEPGDAVEHALAPGRRAWVQVTRGALSLNGERLEAGDGAAVTDTAEVRLSAAAGNGNGTGPGEALVFDLA